MESLFVFNIYDFSHLRIYQVMHAYSFNEHNLHLIQFHLRIRFVIGLIMQFHVHLYNQFPE